MTKNAQDSVGRKLFMMNIWRKQAEKLMDLRSNQKMARTLGMTVRKSTISSRERRLSKYYIGSCREASSQMVIRREVLASMARRKRRLRGRDTQCCQLW